MSGHIPFRFGLVILIAALALAVVEPDSAPQTVAEAASPVTREFVENFVWQGNHGSTVNGGAGTTVWWNENSWDARTDTSFNGAVAEGGNDHIDIHKSVDDLGSGVVQNNQYVVGGDGSAGVGVMHVHFESVANSRLRNPMLISDERPGVVEFRTSNFVTTGHWWEVVITPTDIVTPGEFTAVPSPDDPFGAHPGAGHRRAQDAINYITIGSTDVPCISGWSMKNGVTRSVNGVTQDFFGPNISTDPSLKDVLFAWRLEYYPDKIVAFVDKNRDGIKEHHSTINVDVPWSEVYVSLMAVGYQAHHHPQDGDCGAYQGMTREIPWKDVKVSPVKYARTSSYPKNEGAVHVPQNTGWMFYDMRDTQRFGPASANPPQANERQYSSHTDNAFCRGSDFTCASGISSKTLSFNLPAQDAVGIARAQLVYDIKNTGGATLFVNGVNAGSLPKKATISASVAQSIFWAQRSFDVDPTLFVPGQNTITLNLEGDVAFDRLNFEFAYADDDDTAPSAASSLTATPASASQIDLDWNAASDPESSIIKYEIYRNGNLAGSTASTSYSDKGLKEATSYSYHVVAINGAGLKSAASSSASATTFADTTRPALLSVKTLSATQVKVTFSEPLDLLSAANPLNYGINGITILAASLGADLKTVTLTTSAHSEGVSYTLTVSNIKDLASIANTITANTQLSYVFALEVVISNLTVTSGRAYEVDDFGTGKVIYTDRTYQFQSVPASLTGAVKYIRTANSDKLETSNPFLSFGVNQNVTVLVGYDDRLTRPAWLQSFTDTGDNLTVSGNPHSLYASDFPQGTVTLGGNAGASDSSMYFVLMVGQGGVSDSPSEDPPADDPPADDPPSGNTPPPAPGSLPWLHVEGNKIVNESGDIVVLRGVNIENREWIWGSSQSIDFERRAIPIATRSPADGDGWGANVILIAVASGPINRNNQAYLAALDEIVSIAKAEGAYTLMVYRYGEPNSQQAHFPDQAAEDAMAALAARYANEPAVLYGLQVEPSQPGSIYENLSQQAFWDQVLKPRFDTMVAAIHSNNPNALITVPGTQWSRKIHWALTNPVVGENLVYKTHPYDTWNSIQSSYRLDEVAAIYPVMLGEFGPGAFMSMSDVNSLLDFAEQHGMSWVAWLFHQNGCPCLVSEATNFTPSSPYGEEIKARLQEARTGSFKVLVFHKTGDFVHSSTVHGVAAVHQLGVENGFEVVDTTDSTAFTDANLAQYDAVVFLNTHQEVLNDTQQAAFERYIRAGGGFVGIHIASGTEYSWDWYGNLVGARFNFHPAIQQAAVRIEDPNHPATASLPTEWLVSDEWYNFFNGPDRSKLHVLATVDETTYSGGTHGSDHPVIWCQNYDGGRSFYTQLGHINSHYTDTVFLSHILGGIEWAAGAAYGDCSVGSSAPPAGGNENTTPLTAGTGKQYLWVEGGMGSGATLYTDRAYLASSVPASLNGASYVRTANDDKSSSISNLISFTAEGAITVYVAYDVRATSLPGWLSGWSNTGLTLGTSTGNFSLYSKAYASGSQITLGGNMATGASFPSTEFSMYFVIIAGGNTTPPGGNASPTASFTAAPGSGVAPLTVAFNASGSSDSDGQIASYAWTYGDGQTGTGASVTHVYASAGSYTARLTITDDDGATATATTLISVSAPGGSPVLTAQNAQANEGDTFEVPIVLSSAPNGISGFNLTVSLGNSGAARIVDIELPNYGLDDFNIVSGSQTSIAVTDVNHLIEDGAGQTTLATVILEALSQGTTSIILDIDAIDDDSGASAAIQTVNGTATIGNVLPALDSLPDLTVMQGQLMSVEAALSDPGDSLWTIIVNFGDGSAVETFTTNAVSFDIEHTYADSGQFTVSVTARDDNGAEDQATFAVTVTPARPTLPGMNAPVNDNDGDGLAEDLNGNGRLDFADVVSLFENLDHSGVQEKKELFDFNGNGRLDMDDIRVLFLMLVSP